MTEPITAEWLASVGFRWHQLDRQPDRHWLLWLGRALASKEADAEDLGIELAPRLDEPSWFCWLRSDLAGRYHRFLHIRYLSTQAEVAELVAALTGTPWAPENHLYGAARTPDEAARLRTERERLDRRLMLDGRPWSEVEKGDTRGGALPEHLEAHEVAREGKGQ
jgi:hypothetical protein